MATAPIRRLDHEPERLAAVIAAHAAPRPADPGAVVVTEADWPSLRPWLELNRLTGLALAAVDDDALRLAPTAMAELEDAHRGAMNWALSVERTALRISSALSESGIDAVVLKGSAFAHRFYPDPSWRPFGDLDLLVRTADLDPAGVVLGKLGITRTLPEPRPGFDRRFGTGAVHRSAGGIEVDLHRTIVKGPFGLWIRPDELFDATEEFALGGRPLRRLDATASLLHACVHAALGSLPPMLLPLRDVVQIGRDADVDWDRLADWTKRWRLAPVIAHAFDTVAQVLGVPAPPEARALTQHGSRRRERQALLAYTTDRQRRGGRVLSTMRAIPGVRKKLAYALALALPSKTFLAARQGGRASYVRRWTVPFRWLLRKP